MKVLALNSSPRVGGGSLTELLLNKLVEGLSDSGADVEVEVLRDKNIKACIGCFTCWTKTPGTCIQKDDMSNELFPKWMESDLVVYATPLYNYAMTASMKAFIERTLPALQPFFEIQDNRMFHPLRGNYPAAVVLSVSGMPDEDHFKALSAHVRYFFGSPGRRLIAEIYRPVAGLLTMPNFKEKADYILGSMVQAGRELGAYMEISDETIAKITQPIVDLPSFAAGANTMFKTCIEKGLTPKELAEKGKDPRQKT